MIGYLSTINSSHHRDAPRLGPSYPVTMWPEFRHTQARIDLSGGFEMDLRFLPKNTWMVARIGTLVESISIHATKEEALAECALRNAGENGSYCALIKMGGPPFLSSDESQRSSSSSG
jgi:hypothetical protein